MIAKKIMASTLLMFMLPSSGAFASDNLENDDFTRPEVISEQSFKIDENLFDNSTMIQPLSHIKYKVHLVNKFGEVGRPLNQKVSGTPGMTINLSHMQGVGVTGKTNVDFKVKGVAEASLGFSFGKQVTHAHSGSFTVPAYHNGRKVKRVEVSAYEYFEKYQFKVTWTSSKVKTPQYYGSYWATNPVGYHYEKKFIYE